MAPPQNHQGPQGNLYRNLPKRQIRIHHYPNLPFRTNRIHGLLKRQKCITRETTPILDTGRRGQVVQILQQGSTRRSLCPSSIHEATLAIDYSFVFQRKYTKNTFLFNSLKMSFSVFVRHILSACLSLCFEQTHPKESVSSHIIVVPFDM